MSWGDLRMSDMYCVYNGKKYKIKKKNDKYIITSRVRKEDFIIILMY